VIRVRDDGSVRVTVPRGGSKREAQAFAQRERSWIDKQRQRLEHRRQELAAASGRAPASEDRELRERAKHLLPTRLLELAEEHGVAVSRVSIRNQKSRWGSCSRTAHICLNWRLILMPEFVRDYVMIHELMHLKRMDHSPRFWKLVAAACPDYAAARRWLRTAHP
jgi:predicted metal-dependent hydrolase